MIQATEAIPPTVCRFIVAQSGRGSGGWQAREHTHDYSVRQRKCKTILRVFAHLSSLVEGAGISHQSSKWEERVLFEIEFFFSEERRVFMREAWRREVIGSPHAMIFLWCGAPRIKRWDTVPVATVATDRPTGPISRFLLPKFLGAPTICAVSESSRNRVRCSCHSFNT